MSNLINNWPEPTVQFCKDVAGHQMTILKDDGVYRHVRFAVPGRFENAFEIVTVPGSLMIRGDMGCYVFERVDDMFAFFRPSFGDHVAQGVAFGIKPRYWAEKLVSVASHGGVMEFCREKFEAAVKAEFNFWKAHVAPGVAVSREVWAEIESQILLDEISSVESAHRAIAEFHVGPSEASRILGTSGDSACWSSSVAPDFTDFFEVEIERYTYHFLWCCAAVAWAVAFYDAHRPDVSSAAVSDLLDTDMAAYCGT